MAITGDNNNVVVVSERAMRRARGGTKTPVGRRRLLFGVAMTALAGVAVAVAVMAGPPADKAGPDHVSAGVSDDGSGYLLGDALQLTTVKLMDGHAGWGAVFPHEAGQAAGRFTPASYARTGDDRFFADELRAGAFGLGGMSVFLQASDVSGRPVTIFDVRVVRRRRLAPLTGEVRNLMSQGEPSDEMAFSLDASTPVAKVVRSDSPGSPGKQDYFEATTIPLNPNGTTETLAMTFSADSGAYAFDIAVDYTLGGRKYTQLVTNGGRPFRATASLCSPALQAKRLRYDKAFVRGVDARGERYILAPVAPEKFCTRW